MTIIRDDAYRRSFKGRSCEACGRWDETIVGAHVRVGHEGGVGLKPSDDLIIALCYQCHSEQEANPGARWWVENLVKPQARRAYQEWARRRR
jgi:hypothetical protein